MNRFYARSASDKSDDYPLWFVADSEKGGLNVTVSVAPELRGHMPFVPKDRAIELAATANEIDS